MERNIPTGKIVGVVDRATGLPEIRKVNNLTDDGSLLTIEEDKSDVIISEIVSNKELIKRGVMEPLPGLLEQIP